MMHPVVLPWQQPCPQVSFIVLDNNLCFSPLPNSIHFVKFNRTIFTWLSKVICIYFGLGLLRLVIGLKFRATFSTNQKPKTFL